MTASWLHRGAIVTHVTTPAERYNRAVGQELQGQISAAGSNIAEMARKIGISRSALDNYTKGKRDIPVPVLYTVCTVIRRNPHTMLRLAEERLQEEDSRPDAVVTPLRPRADVRGRRDDVAEVAFESEVPHGRDTDDLYD